MFDETQKQAIWAKVKAKTKVNERGCWEWTGVLNSYGYAQCFFFGKRWMVHRITYVLTHGVELQRSTYICHTCDNPACCNPEHLWAGRSRDNLLDCVAKGRHQEANQTHCKRGHPLSGDNVRVCGGRRQCRICHRARFRMSTGWPADLAFSLAPIPSGQKTPRRDFQHLWKSRLAKRSALRRSPALSEK
jgi:hypothetical protein